MDYHCFYHSLPYNPAMLLFPWVPHQLDLVAIGLALRWENKMKFTRIQAYVIVAGTILWFLMMLTCYGLGLFAHQAAHSF